MPTFDEGLLFSLALEFAIIVLSICFNRDKVKKKLL